MHNETISIDDGLVSYDINGKVKITLNPTDADFFGRLYNVFSALSDKQKEREAAIDKVEKNRVFDYMRELDKEMREIIDNLFNPICDKPSLCEALYGSMNLYSYSGGLPVWCNFILAVMEKADGAIKAQQMLSKPALQKYTAKYHR